jgi:hypothetical protein
MLPLTSNATLVTSCNFWGWVHRHSFESSLGSKQNIFGSLLMVSEHLWIGLNLRRRWWRKRNYTYTSLDNMGPARLVTHSSTGNALG